MKNIKILFALFVVLSVFSSCRKDSLFTEMEMTPVVPVNNIETTITGFITTTDGDPIEDAEVLVFNTKVYTNEFGFFEITDLVNEKFALITIKKEGYFKQFETFTPGPSRTAHSQTRIQLIERTVSGNFAASAGGKIDIGSSSVAFQANSIEDESGSPYTGEVSVYTHFIDPTDEDIDQFMPGNLMAINAEEEVNILESFGMINVELEGQNGEVLNINQAATIEVDVPTELEGNAPASIPLWYFDENDGLWKEEGTATLQNGKYIGTVNHFTFWNCDVPFALTFINGQVVDPRGISVVRVRITDQTTGASFTSWTDSEGFFAGGVPQNTDLLLEVLGFCGENDVLFSTTIGPFTQNEVDLGVYTIMNNNTFTFITGTLVDCDLLPVGDGQVYINLPDLAFSQQTLTDQFGNFGALVPTCVMDEITIWGMNLLDGLVSQVVTVNADNGNNIMLGDIEVCADISANLGSVIMYLDDEEKVFDNCTVRMTNNNDSISYLFTYGEALPPVGDSIIYYWLIQDNNGDLSNPNWSNSSLFFSPPASAENALHYTYSPFYQVGLTNLVIDQEAEFIGDIMQLSLDNIRISRRIKDPDGPNVVTTFNGVSMSITAVLEQ